MSNLYFFQEVFSALDDILQNRFVNYLLCAVIFGSMVYLILNLVKLLRPVSVPFGISNKKEDCEKDSEEDSDEYWEYESQDDSFDYFQVEDDFQ